MNTQPIGDESRADTDRQQPIGMRARVLFFLSIITILVVAQILRLPSTPVMAGEIHLSMRAVDGTQQAIDITPPITRTIGYSIRNRPIEAVQVGDGPRHLVLIGGIHGGAEWNTVLLAREAIDFFRRHPDALPANLTLTIIPAANPDGLARVLGHAGSFAAADARTNDPEASNPGRFNSRGVDLNRNWACSWQRVGYWGAQEVSGGFVPFSEAETRALGAFLTAPPVDGVIFWHSAAVGVYAGGCNGRFAPSDALGRVYADGSGYPFQLAFSHYPITGDATDWLATKGIPAVVVELSGRTDTEWVRNLAGVEAVFAYLAEDGEIGR